MVDYKDIEIKAKKISEIKNIGYYELLQRFMFERILERISISKYNDNFILKGGLFYYQLCLALIIDPQRIWIH